jgi:hypothetical protein
MDSEKEGSSTTIASEKPLRDRREYQSVLLAVLSGAIVAYFLNLVTSQLQLSISVGQVFRNESLDALFAFAVVGSIIVLLLFFPTLVIQKVLLKTTGKKVGLISILFDIVISVMLAFFFLFLVIVALSLIIDFLIGGDAKMSTSWENFISMVIYYLMTSFIASYIIWKRRLVK